MSKDSDLFSVVVLGNMNPRIHHPLWYGSVGIFSEKEVADSIQTQPVVCTPAFAQFNAGDSVIKCLQERWDVQTTKREKIDQIREIAQKIFDDFLPHTPVTAVALNFDFVRELAGSNVADFIASRLNSAVKSMGIAAATGGDLVVRRPLDPSSWVLGTSTIALRSTEDPHNLILACNYTYAIKNDGQFTQFTMADFLPSFAKRDQADAESSLSGVLAAINAS